jgi:hypothetical protein
MTIFSFSGHHIINIPKGAPTLTYINYDDICYSQWGPRETQVFLIYIQYLMANCVGKQHGVWNSGRIWNGRNSIWVSVGHGKCSEILIKTFKFIFYFFLNRLTMHAISYHWQLKSRKHLPLGLSSRLGASKASNRRNRISWSCQRFTCWRRMAFCCRLRFLYNKL